MGRHLVVGGVIAGAVALVALAALVVLYLVLNHSETVRLSAARTLSGVFGREVQVSTLSVGLGLPPTVRVGGIAVAENAQFGRGAFFTIEEADVTLRLRPLLEGRAEPAAVTLKNPRIVVTRDEAGGLNLSGLGGGPANAPAARPAVEAPSRLAGTRLEIDDGLVVYDSEAATGASRSYRLDSLNLAGQVDTALALTGTARLQPGNVGVQVVDASLPLPGGQPLRAAPLRARLTITTADVHDLGAELIGASPVLGGALTGTINLGGTFGGLEAAGDLHAPHLSVSRAGHDCPDQAPHTLTLDAVSVNAAWHDGRLTGEPTAAQLGGGSVSANLVASPEGPGVRVALNDLVVTGVPLEPLLVGFFCAGYAVTGTLALEGNLSWGSGSATETMAGFGQVEIGAGKVVGSQALDLLATVARLGGAVSSLLSLHLPLSLFYSPLDFDSITGRYDISRGVLHIRELLYNSTAMKIAASGEYGLTNGQLNLQMVVNHDRGEVLATVTGSAASPSVRVRPTTILRDLDPASIERGLRGLLDRIP